MNKQRLIILVLAVLGMLAVFMPWVNMPIVGAVNGARGDGWFVFCLYAIPAIIAVLGNRAKPLQGAMLYGAIVPGLICSGVAIWKMIDFNNAMKVEDGNPFAAALSSTVSIGFGLYLVILLGIAIAASAYLFKEKTQES